MSRAHALFYIGTAQPQLCYCGPADNLVPMPEDVHLETDTCMRLSERCVGKPIIRPLESLMPLLEIVVKFVLAYHAGTWALLYHVLHAVRWLPLDAYRLLFRVSFDRLFGVAQTRYFQKRGRKSVFPWFRFLWMDLHEITRLLINCWTH